MKGTLVLVLVSLAFLTAGCPVHQSQKTPVRAIRAAESSLGTGYWLYVPSYYSSERDWPLVVTLHGTYGFESSRLQIMEWKRLAEDKGFLVVAPDLRSVQGILPVNQRLWFRDLDHDQRAILAVMNELSNAYRIDRKYVMLTGFSAGSYPMYSAGLANPGKFNMLVSRAGNSDLAMLDRIELTDEARRMPIRIFWGRDDLKPIANQGWAAFRWLRQHGFKNVGRKKISGGHVRHPEVAYKYWRKTLPESYRRE